jgi:hypothetical protein
LPASYRFFPAAAESLISDDMIRELASQVTLPSGFLGILPRHADHGRILKDDMIR